MPGQLARCLLSHGPPLTGPRPLSTATFEHPCALKALAAHRSGHVALVAPVPVGVPADRRMLTEAALLCLRAVARARKEARPLLTAETQPGSGAASASTDLPLALAAPGTGTPAPLQQAGRQSVRCFLLHLLCSPRGGPIWTHFTEGTVKTSLLVWFVAGDPRERHCGHSPPATGR